MVKRYHGERFHVWCEVCDFRAHGARAYIAEIKKVEHNLATGHKEIIVYEVRLPRVRPHYLKPPS